MKKFKPSLMTLSLLSAGLSLQSGAILAQESNTTTDQESELEIIQVKGFRGSVIKSLNTKRFADTVVDAISADDIGGLPDVSIADALTRLPGVTSVRRDGQSSELNIRGLSGGFVLSTLNGREQVSSSGGRRGAQMGTIDCQHPDIMAFIKAKREDGRLRQFNLSLLISDDFMNAVKNNEDWPLNFPLTKKEAIADNIDLDDSSVVLFKTNPAG